MAIDTCTFWHFRSSSAQLLKRDAHSKSTSRNRAGQDHASNVEQRGLRLVEEAIEAAQAAGCDPATLHKLVDYIYAKEPGDLRQELGGVGLCVLAMAAVAGFDADEAEEKEVNRVLSKPLDYFARRNKVKNDAGFVAGYQQPIQS